MKYSKIKAVVAFVAVCLLVGCKDRVRPNSLVGQFTHSDAERAAERKAFYRGQCVQLGIKLNTPEMDVCIASKPDNRRRDTQPLDPVLQQQVIDLGKPKCRDGRLPDPMYGCGRPTMQQQPLRCNTNMFGQTTCW